MWKRLEAWVRKTASREGAIYVVTGPVWKASLIQGRLRRVEPLGTIGQGVTVPGAYFKVVVDHRETQPRGIGFVLANKGSKRPLSAFAVTIDSVEVLTGLDLFPGLVDGIEEAMEGRLRIADWGF